VYFLERDSMVTISPGFGELPEGLTKFRWKMQISLPYPFAAKECVQPTATLLDNPFNISIHNHYNRIPTRHLVKVDIGSMLGKKTTTR
jgi:hypothetical protein